jgi:hypothetical protein
MGMTRRLITALIGLALLTFVVVWAVVHYGFIYIGGRGFEITEMMQKPVLVPVGDAERIHLAVHMVYGDLQLKSGTVGVLTGTTRYNVAEFAPHVLYEEEGNRGRLLVDHLQGADNTRLINRRGRINEWQLLVNDHLPIEEFEVVVALGSARLDLRGLNLRHATLALLAGDFTVDLRGDWEQSSLVQIDGLSGTINVLLPSETGTLVMLDSVPRTLHVSGLKELAAPPSPASLPTAAEAEWGATDEGEGGQDTDYDAEDHRYFANASYAEGSTNLYIQVADAFGTLNLTAE